MDSDAQVAETRYFVAIPLSDQLGSRLAAVQPPCHPGMRLIGSRELHLTLHFLGTVPAETKDTLCRSLSHVTAGAFTLVVRGIGRFPKEGPARVLWCGIQDSHDLIALREQVATILYTAIGFQPEQRPYIPHVTLARLDVVVPPSSIEAYLETHRDFEIAPVAVDQLALYSSVPSGNAWQYQEEVVVPLIRQES